MTASHARNPTPPQTNFQAHKNRISSPNHPLIGNSRLFWTAHAEHNTFMEQTVPDDYVPSSLLPNLGKNGVRSPPRRRSRWWRRVGCIWRRIIDDATRAVCASRRWCGVGVKGGGVGFAYCFINVRVYIVAVGILGMGFSESIESFGFSSDEG